RSIKEVQTMTRSQQVLCGALALTVLAGLSLSAPAQAARSQTELTFFNGYYIASDLYSTVGYATPVQIGLNNGYMWGGRLGVVTKPHLELEFVYTRTGSDLQWVTAKPPLAPSNLGRINGNSYDLDFLFLQPSSAKATPYFSLGFGWTVTDPKVPAPTGTPPVGYSTPASKSLFAWNFGAGAKIDMNDKFLLRLEGRWRVTDTAITTSSGTYCDYYGYCYTYSSDWYSNGELTVGLTYKLPNR
ncbi:MAG: outer membrane beta-barrel protein, partial [Candidatus Eiseniibacteriota bacterium]